MAEGTVINHQHDDGRQCVQDGTGWWHYYCRCRLQHRCDRAHPPAEARRVNIDGPEPVRVSPLVEDFHHPGVGTAWSPASAFEVPTPVGHVPYDADIDVQIEATIDVNGIMVQWADHENGYQTPAVTDDAKYILTAVLPDLITNFLKSNAKYANAQVHDLGVKGIVPDVNRKTSVIIDRLWHGAPTVGEDTAEVIDDLIGHLLLMRAKMRSE